MPRIVRAADVGWNGNLARGEGALTAASGAFDALPVSLATRIAVKEGRTSPEELLAAAHGGCFTMSLAGELTQAGSPPGRLDVRCTITMDEVAGAGHRIIGSRIDVRGRVDGIDGARFEEVVRIADEGCSFSALLRAAGVRIETTTRLEDG